ncbi:MAG: bifunctional oligoribonuclease/PAP phosphatase NrnA [Sulfurovum sp.]|nr:bifunctional oligoribonuclease/PAP phosphatase NrnA [Sulfurovum sp.]
MFPIVQYRDEFKVLLNKYKKITVLSHINPDPDAIGTALGVYIWLKEQKFHVEIANITEDIPRSLDFLPSFSKIKKRIDFEDSLIIACDCGSIDRLGFQLDGREIINIDHHATNSYFATLNIIDPEAVSSSEVAYHLLKDIYPISKESAVAFYVALASDTRNFTTNNMHQGIFNLASELTSIGVDIVEVSQKMLHRRSLASLRILGVAINSLELKCDAKIAVLKISQENLKQTGAKYSDLDGVVDYAKSLATVEIALMLVERKKDIKVSIRSKTIDISKLATHFGGGGHNVAGGFEVSNTDLDGLSDIIVNYIQKGGLLHETKI